MSNRLEQEFPPQRWLPVPPAGHDGLSGDLVQSARARGHELRSLALRRAGRSFSAGVTRALSGIATFLHCAAYGIAKRPPEHDCRCAPPRGA